MNIKAAVKSLRLRTLPLSTAGVVLGILLAAADYHISWAVAILIVTTTVCLQILTNLSNELGDVLHGTDTAERQGPQYGLNSGELTVRQMKLLIKIFVGLCVISGLAMTWVSFGTFFDLTPILVLMLGAAAITAAMRYTLGRNPYGYRGLGDLFVFLFFGIVSVAGSYFVAAHEISSWKIFLPAAAIGFFSVAVLNVNNIRDMKTDAENRVTVAIKLGEHRAKIYQTILIVLGWAAMIAFCCMRIFDPWHYLYVLTFPLYVLHVIGVWKRHDSELDPMLPLLVMSTFAFALLGGLGFVVYLF